MTAIQLNQLLTLMNQILSALELIARWQFYGVVMTAVLVGVTLAVIWAHYKPFC